MGSPLLHITAFILGIAYPVYAIIVFRKIYLNVRHRPSLRLFDYKRTILILWSLTILVIYNLSMGQPTSIRWFRDINTAGYVFGILIVSFIVLQFRQQITNSDAAKGIKERMNGVWDLLPKSSIEMKWFVGLSLSAGICEEIIFRFFLYEYLIQMLPVGIAILIVNLLFAMTHAGSGWTNMAGAFVLGVIFSIIYYFSGYLLLPVILHSAIDINTGVIGFRTLRYLKSHPSG